VKILIIKSTECRPTKNSNKFACIDGACISSLYRCDGRPDCDDLSDEEGCECTRSDQCPGENPTCKEGKCKNTFPRLLITSEVIKEEWGRCNKCFGTGTHNRTSKILGKSSNADTGYSAGPEIQECNAIQQYEGCSEDKHLENYRFNYFESDITDSDTFLSPLEAMEACLKDKTCCGISHNRSDKWFLPKKHVKSTELQIRKDCYIGGYTSTYCKDKTPETCKLLLQDRFNGDITEFQENYCNKGKVQEINCLKTCRRCL